jgi:hypothetical protein
VYKTQRSTLRGENSGTAVARAGRIEIATKADALLIQQHGKVLRNRRNLSDRVANSEHGESALRDSLPEERALMIRTC